MMNTDIIDAITIRGFQYTTDYQTQQGEDGENHVPHSHDCFELFIMLEGELFYNVKKRKYHLRPTELIVVPPKHSHLVTKEKEQTKNAVVRGMTFQFEIQTELPLEFAFLTEVKKFRLNSIPEIITLIHTIVHHRSIFSQNEFQVLLKTYTAQFLMLLYKFSHVSIGEDKSLSHLTLHIIAFINQHLTEKINVKALASTLKFTESYMTKTFKKDMKLSIMQYIKQRRMLLAESLIFGGEKPIQAMYKSGFTDYSNFFKEFVKTYGITPKEMWLKYRKEAPQDKKR